MGSTKKSRQRLDRNRQHNPQQQTIDSREQQQLRQENKFPTNGRRLKTRNRELDNNDKQKSNDAFCYPRGKFMMRGKKWTKKQQQEASIIQGVGNRQRDQRKRTPVDFSTDANPTGKKLSHTERRHRQRHTGPPTQARL